MSKAPPRIARGFEPRSRPGSRAAFTLVELMASMAIMSLVLGGIATSLVLASRAIPDDRSPLERPLQGINAATEVAGDLVTALSFNQRSANVIEFTVPDRNNNGSDEVIKYEWSGIPGDPLKRTYNVGTAIVIASDVYEFNLTYQIANRTDHTESPTSTTGSEVMLASFESWSGIAAIGQEYPVTKTSWVGECFQIAPPADAKELIFTRAQVTMRRDNSIVIGSPNVTAGIHPSDTTKIPNPAPLGAPATDAWTNLPLSFLWHSFTFPGAKSTNLTVRDYCLVIKSPDAAVAYVRELYDSKAPDNGVVEKWTATSGVSWSPAAKDINKQDIRFYVYGQYVTRVPAGTPYERKFIKGVEITVLVGKDGAARATTGVELLNAPEIPVP